MTPPLTVVGARGVLSRRLGPYAGLADLDDALRRGLASLGIATADPITPADADLLPLVSTQLDQLYDVAHERALWSVLENLDPQTLANYGIVESPERIDMRLRQRAERAREFVLRAYGVGLPTLQVGVVGLGFAADGTRPLYPDNF